MDKNKNNNIQETEEINDVKKKRKAKEIMRYVVLAISMIVFLIASSVLYKAWKESRAAKDEYDKMKESVREPGSTKENESSQAPGEDETDASISAVTVPELPSSSGNTNYQPPLIGTTKPIDPTAPIEQGKPTGSIANKPLPALASLPNIRFDLLKKRNEEVIGYIEIPGTDISYPICQTTDNSHYLRYTASNIENNAGAIFLDYQQTSNFTDPSTIVYGHYRNDDTMFTQLHRYRDMEFWKENPFVYIITPDEKIVYEICAVYENPYIHGIFRGSLREKEHFQKYVIDNMNERRLYDTGINVTTDDTVITMVCCTDDESVRFIVNAIRR